MIRFLMNKLRRFRYDEYGVTAIEYGVIIALISGTLLVVLPAIGDSISNPMTEIAAAIDNGGASSGGDNEGSGGSDDGGDGGGDDHGDDDHGDDDEGDDDHEDD